MNEKKMAGERAAEYVKDGMLIGLGTGSTVYYTINRLGERVKNGLEIHAVSTSNRTLALADSLGIPMADLTQVNEIDLTIDGVDEFDAALNGIKGGGGALLFEKIVASCSRQNIWVADSSKYVEQLGSFPLPVEVIPMASYHLMHQFEEKKMQPKLRMAGTEIYRTDSQNYIIDLNLERIDEPEQLGRWLKHLTGVVEHGLFLNLADQVILSQGNEIKVMERRREAL